MGGADSLPPEKGGKAIGSPPFRSVSPLTFFASKGKTIYIRI
jgi:hypothetical protein